ncbi:Crp/Fnr family transcriptional regulator [Vibrio metschnikovii]|uniref:Crp/Fnr family transcriptional regulator n=4 Tax=Unclassified Bacteria TaxID=49928 RepID=A0AAU6SWM4_UNCXX|nr:MULTISPECIES: Crp/Fnr family transcriptional regulator [Vibrio]EKO3558389.1 Crp/Fnr family transcriptional regulator [Vibrio metschnikovii]EKO3564852.1 Crp/Fnr family transcriptional regulator [Vibrio metschnikovii]EKO3568381.1 Crp/Fnr family transcriptional regulator [Vibrio metschnikovii]EKO3572177.1 Crp/Fnr family transcriptional regulator [Vibrio metschnikovii]EKO3580414.1 Crp/Fnr family transcriptional regulator [Vibrio metschnikovii]
MYVEFEQQLSSDGFEPHEINQLISCSQPLELPTRHILIHQGDIPQQIYFVLEGVCHACYLTEQGKSFSKEFYWAQDWVIGFESLIKHQASPYLLETLTPVRLIELPIHILHSWRATRHSLYLKLLETQLMHKENKERFMLLYSPEERYQLFNDHFSALKKQLTNGQIAAYLGITPISLSRIKARINAKASD